MYRSLLSLAYMWIRRKYWGYKQPINCYYPGMNASQSKVLWIIDIVTLIFIAATPYLSSLSNNFVAWDDDLLITQNPIIQEFSTASVYKAFTSYDPELYVPLTLLSYQLDHLIAGLNPFIYHFTNLLLHIANVLLLVWIARLMGLKRWSALALAALFAVHPLNTEAVAWASARKDLLSSFFMLWSVGAYLRYTEEGSRRWYTCSILLALLGMLSKVTVIMIPAVLLLLDWYRERPLRSALTDKIPFAILSIAFAIIAMLGKETSSAFLWEKFLIGFKAITLYLFNFIAPLNLSVLYPYTEPISFSTPDIALSAALTIAITTVALWLWRAKNIRLPLFAWGWYILLLLPTFNNATKGRNELLDVYVGSDRYAYLPIIGLLLLILIPLERRMERLPAASVSILVMILLSFSLIAHKQSLTWKDSTSLFTQAAKVSPNSYVAHTNIGTQLFHNGDIDGALGSYQKALTIRSDATAWFNVGQIMILKEEPAKAEQAFRAAIKASPLEIDAHLQLARLLLQRGESGEALSTLFAAQEVAPERADVQQLIEVVNQAGN